MIVEIKPTNMVTISINRISVPLAAFSYTLYLTHYPLISLLNHFGFKKSDDINLHSLCLFLLAIAFALVVGYAVYWVFERRTPLVKKWILK
jgi:peptidoglycan/LPS O-acetylase OafA/YrhL